MYMLMMLSISATIDMKPHQKVFYNSNEEMEVLLLWGALKPVEGYVSGHKF